jgi:homogentisate 1,2-dioxygenase
VLDRLAQGDLPPKHHVALRSAAGKIRYEECLTRMGFDGPYSILYHEHPPHALEPIGPDDPSHAVHSAKALEPFLGENAPLRRRHYRTAALPKTKAPLDSRVPLLFNEDVTIFTMKPSASDPMYFVDGDGDELFFARSGRGVLRSVFGDLAFSPGDYVAVPKGTLYRLVLETPDLDLLLIECKGGVGLPRQWRNEVGQLRMDAPYSHRDFRRPSFRGPLDEGIRNVIVKRNGTYHGFRHRHSPLDVVGWDGTVYPWAFPILAFQPRVSSVHLPPIWHGTFAARGALICSFVPRPLDFHPDAVPCPYPHSSVDVDEVLYYVSGDFSSRSGVEVGSLTLHPAGIPHGPHPGRYEASPGARRTDEVAVMLDCYKPLVPTVQARGVEDPDYDRSFSGDPAD